jgi:hypothetical protein
MKDEQDEADKKKEEEERKLKEAGELFCFIWKKKPIDILEEKSKKPADEDEESDAEETNSPHPSDEL